MGLFSKIKNYITGGAAEVSVVYENPKTDGQEPMRLFVVANARDSCKIKNVYLEIRGMETYKKRETRTSTDSNGNVTTTTHDVTTHYKHFERKMVLDEDVQMQEGEERKWLGEFDLPTDALPTYHGKDCFMKWEVFAGLDMPGNDPDSGWVEFFIQKEMNYDINNTNGAF